ncbi:MULTISPECIES: halocyanin domain-containing protein [Halorubrum]|uniref:Halocyanin hcpA n=1 Tax=Halorubrum hochstenium ATCC 700873 TaxID=1227481 RepID=M0FFR6_9EURY|nr:MULTISPECIES: halocyanin domain-containing protein [Halorubrum]ELZ58871.1 halocyanin hcpA [Halorubrum hochstenium ATCC 700873]
MPSTNRRAFLGASTVVGLGSLVALGNRHAANAETERTTSEHGNDSLENWLATANDPRTPQIRDFRFDDPPTVYLDVSNSKSFSPPAIKVAPGTTVTWEWTGSDDEYNVVATDGTFDSGGPDGETETTFEYTFESEGVYRYVSEPQADAGMKGVVVVESAPSSGYPAVDEWLVDTNGYDGSVTDRTDERLVEITTGAEGNGGNLAFDPHAVKVSTETTVRWSWTGSGGAHDVAFEDADIGGETIDAEPGVHFEHTFNEPGVFRYACRPHRAIGHRGAIIVE